MAESGRHLRRRSEGAGSRRPVAWLVALTLVLGLLGPIVGPTSPAAAAPTAASRWTFDAGSGTTAADSVGTKPATLTSGASWGAGIQGASALVTNGSSGAAVTSSTVLNTSTSFTVSAWVKLNSLSGYQTVVSQDASSVSGFYLGLRGDNGRFSFTRPPADSTSATGTVVPATSAPVVGQWYHIVGVYDSAATTMGLYVNGRLQQTLAAPPAWNATGNLAIGRAKYNGGSVDWLNGTVDDVRVYSSALSATDVEQITESARWKFEEGSGTSAADDSANAYTGTLTNGPTWTPGEIGTTGVLFDGSNDSVTTTNSVVDTSKSFSVSAWARADGATTGNNMAVSVDGTNSSGFYLQLGNAGKWAFNRSSADVASPGYTAANSTAAVVSGTWYHLVGVYDSVAQTLVLYVNGVKQSTVSFTSGWKATGNLVIGRGKVGGSSAGYWNGAIDDVRAYSYVLDDAAVTALAGTAPTAPTTPGATAGASSATLTWAAPSSNGGSNLTGYLVTPYKDGTAQTPVTYNASTTTRTLTGLTPGSSYTFTVAAQNPIGTSPASAASTAVTPYDVPSAPSITAVTAGDLRATVTWTTPSTTGGSPITGYVVTPFVGTTAQPPTTFASTALTQTVTGLTAGTAYTFKVAAQNANGTGTPSAASSAVTPNANPTLTFAAPPGGVIGTAYSTQLTVNGGTAPFTWSVSSGTLPAGITLSSGGLLSGTPTTAGTSTFTVQVTDANNQSPTRSVSLTVTSTTPAAPAAPTATAGVNSATVTWTAPAGNGSAVTGYLVTPYLAGVAQTPVSYDASTTTRTLTGLTANGSYTFTVAAVNANGTGPASAQSAAVVPYDVPSASSISAATAGDLRVTLTWTAPASNGRAITGYVVTPYLGSTPQTPVSFSGTGTTQTVTGLAAGTAYTFRVAAQNAAGTGAASAASAAVIPNANPTLTFAAPPAGVVGTAYSTQLTVNGGTAPTTWSVSSGTLPAGITLSSGGLLSGTPTTVGSSTFVAQVTDANAQSATRSVTLVVSDRPATPAAPTATAGLTSAVVSWTAPAGNGATITGYVITPYVAGTAQTPVTVDPSAKTRTLNGLTAGSTYTFTVAAVNANGSSAGSVASNPVTPYAALNAPTITSVTAGTTSATLSWSAPTSTGGAPITGYVVTPYIGSVAQTPQSFTGTGTTRTVTGLTAGTAYTFKVAALNNSGTTPLYRVDAGGSGAAALDGGPAWSDDSGTDNPFRTSGSNTSDLGAPNSLDSTVPSTTPLGIFNTERWDPGNSMKWAFPVTTGTPITVRLYFVENYLNGPGQRIFDVALDGTTVLSSLDVYTSAGGGRIGTMREFSVTSDGTVNIDFGRVQDNAIIDGIEILQTGTATTGPPSTASASVTPNASPTLTFAAPAPGTVGVGYSQQLTVYGGTTPITWSVSSGTLPAGITLSSGGLLAGTPTTAGSYPFTVQVTDASGQTATRSVTLVIAAAMTLTFGPAAGEVGVAYSQQPTLSGGNSPYVWTISAGSLPAGVSINPGTGLVSGTPTNSGTFSVTVKVTDTTNQVVTRTAGIVIAPLPTLTSAPPKQYQQAGFSFGFAATGGTAPFTYAVVTGSLPSGLSLSSAGVLSGQTNQGSYPFTVRATDAKGQTADDPVTLVVDAPPIQLVKTASATSVAPGGTVTFTLTATNISGTYYGNTHVYDPLADVIDDATYNANAVVSSGSIAYAGSTLDWQIPLSAGQSETLTYTVTVANPDTGNKILTGQVDGVFASTGCSSGQRSSTCTAPVTVSGLTITKTSDVTSTTPGGVVTYRIVATNSGQTPFGAASFSDSLAGVLDDATYGGDAGATSGSLSYANSTLTWTGALAVGASATVTYTVTVANPDTGNRSLSGTVVSSTAGNTCPSANPAGSCSAVVAVLIPALAISTTAGVTSTTPGSPVDFTVSLSNTGETAFTATSVAVALAGALDDAVYNADATASTGSVSYDSGAGALVWTGNLAVGAVVTITASVSVRDPDPGDKTLTAVASSAAAGSTCPAGSTNPACTADVQVLVPQLTVAASTDVSTTTPGSVVRSTVLVTNSGQTPYTGATFATALTGVLDDAVYGGDAGATSGVVSYANSTLTWTGDLAVGASATISYSVTVGDPDPGNRSLTTTAVSTTPGSTCAAGSTDGRCSTTVTVLVPGLSLSAAVDSGATTTPGTTLRSTWTVANSGQTTYTGTAVRINPNGTVDDATYQNDATASVGALSPQPDGTLRWVLTLAPGASATVTASYKVNNPVTGDKAVTTTITSTAPGSTCPTASATPACSTSVSVLIPGLTITTSTDLSSATPGDAVGYTIVVANTGETAYAAATVTDDLTPVLNDAVYAGGATATSGTVTYGSPVLSWTGALAVGASATISFTVTVRDPDPGNKRFVNTVVSSTRGSNCVTGSTDARCATTVNVNVPALTVVATANRATTAPGEVITFTLQITNSGTTAFTGATVVDSLAGAVDDAAYTTATATSGTVGYGAPNLTWTGNLAVGASATVSFTMTVNSADVGDDVVAGSVTSNSRGSNCATGSTDARCSVSVPVARLVLTQTAAETSAIPGSVVHLSTSWANTGQVPYVGISVISPRSDTSDDTTPTGDQQTSSGTLVRSESAVTWTGDIPVGATVTGARTLIVKDPDPGNKLIRATLRSGAAGNNCPTGTTDPQCTFSVSVLVPGLTLTKTASTTATVAGGTVSYTITAQNSGETAYSGAAFSDSLAGVLDDATYNANAAATLGTLSFGSGTLSWVGDLAVGQTATITYSVTVKAQPGDKTMVNPVTSDTVGSTCPAASSNAACRTTVVVLTPGLTLVKTADVANATLGSTVTYTVRVTNSGQTPYPSASFTDALSAVLDDAAYNADATASSGSVSYAGSTLGWSGALSPGASATITYSVTINNPASGDRSMTDTLVSGAAGNNCPAAGSDSRCTVTVAITNAVTLTLTKVADVVATAAGQVVHYTITATNSSGSAVPGADFVDALADITDDATYDQNLVATSGTATYAASAITWAGTVAAGATVTVTYSVTVHATATGDQVLSAQLTSTTPATSNNCLAGSTDPRCTSSVPVAALVIQQAYTEPTTTPGSLLHLTATFTNTGRLDYYGITVSSPSADTVDDAIPTGDQTATSGTLVLSATAITWTGDLPVGATVTVTGTLTVKNPDPGDKQITGTLVSAALGSNCVSGSGDPRCTALSVVQVPELSITKTADTTFVVPGASVGYTITVHNTGETAYDGATVTDSLAGVLDDADYGADAVASSGTVSYADPVLSWTGNLAVGATATITYSATAHPSGTGDKSMVNRVSSGAVGSRCPVGSSRSACVSSVDVRTPALTVVSTADHATALPGDTVTFTATLANTGQTDYPSGSQVRFPLAGLVDDAGYGGDGTASDGALSVTGGALVWTGALVVGDTVTITYAVTVDDPVTGDHLLSVTAGSTLAGSTCPAGSSDPRCTTAVPIASLHLSDTVSVATAQPTTVVRFTETYTNTGQVPYYGIHVTIDGNDVFDDAGYNGDAAASAGSLGLDPVSGNLTWTGDLAVGASVTTTGSVTVNNPDSGNKHLRTRISTETPVSNCPPDSTDPVCLIDVPVLTPELTIVKSADTATTTPGSTVGYTITATNTGETAYAGATVTDALDGLLDDASYRGDASATGGVVSYAGPTLSWTGDLGIGDQVRITYSVLVTDPDPGDANLVNGVVSDAIGSTCPPGGSGSSCTTSVTVLTPALDIGITADRSTTEPGEQVDYTITVHNGGETAYLGATVTSSLAGVLDDADYAGGVTASSGTVAYSRPDLTWTGDIALGETVTIGYSVTVNDPDLGDLSLSTSVSSPAPGSACSAGSPCVHTVSVLIPGLLVTTAASSASALPGDAVTFTTTLTNNGQRLYLGSVATTSLTDVLDDATFSGRVTSSSGLAVYTAPTITWTGSLAVGAQATISYTVVVRDPDPGNQQLSATVVDQSAGSTCRSGSQSSLCTASVDVRTPALGLSVTPDVPITTPGSVVTYTVAIANDGQSPYTGAVVRTSLVGLLDDADYNADAAVVTGGGTLGYAAGRLTWTGDLAVGDSAAVTFSVTVHDPHTGDKQLLATVFSTAAGSTCRPGSSAPACSSSATVAIPGLTVSTVADTTAVVAGSPVHYTVSVQNTGETAYAPATVTWSLADVLDDADDPSDALASRGVLAYDGQTLTWSGALAVGDVATITYTVTTDFPAPGDRSLDTAVVSTSAGSTCVTGAEAGCSTHVGVLVPALTVSKTASATRVVAGGTVGYTLTATNTGQSAYAAAALTDSLAGVLDHADYDADVSSSRGSVDISGDLLSWNGPLAVGQSVVITYSVTVHADVVDPAAALVNRVSSTTIGSTCPVDSADPADPPETDCVTSTGIDPVSIELRGLTADFTLTGPPGSVLSLDGAVVGTVVTNNVGGYSVSVQAGTPEMSAGTSGNPDTIPVDRLLVRADDGDSYTPLSATSSIVVAGQQHPSAPDGDGISNDYAMEVPFVDSDTYSTTLDYIVSSR